MIIDELQLANGKKIDTLTGKVVRSVDGQRDGLLTVPSEREAVEKILNSRKRLIDLPVPPAQMNGLAVIVSYSIMGLSDEDICTALSLTQEQLGRIYVSDAFIEVKNTIIDTILEADTENVRQMFVQHSASAARRVATLAQYAEDEKVQLKASQDILDRAGHRPVDVHEHRVQVEGGLRIEYIEKKPLDLPNVTVIDQ